MAEQPDRYASRRDFLRLTAGAAAVAALGGACGRSDGSNAEPKASSSEEKTLRILQWSHFVPAYDSWFDNDFTRRWGDEHGVNVVVDHLPFDQLRNRADAEVAVQSGHDIFGHVSPSPAYEDHVVDHREIVEEVEARVGKMTPFVEASVFNPRTGRYFGFPSFWVANPVLYRTDLWEGLGPGRRPDAWDDIVAAGPELKAAGHPVGIGMAPDLDHAHCLPALLYAYGASIQDQDGNLTINRPSTVEAVKVGAAIFAGGMTEEVFSWDGASDNRYLASGRASLTIDAISAIRAAEKQDAELAARIALAPIPAGPEARLSPPSVIQVYAIWKFSPHQELAQQFLVDHALSHREGFMQSEFFNLPGFPGTVPDLRDLVANDERAQPPAKYALLAEASEWSTNLGHPGTHNAAIDDVVNQYLIPKMFAAAARGDMSAEEAVAAAEAEMKPIFAKWRELGKL